MKRLLTFLSISLLLSCGDVYEDFPVPPASLVAQFSFEVINEETREVAFTNTSIVPERAGTVTYTWSFGDGTNSTDVSPTHTFPEFGEYEIKLVVISSGISEIKESTMTISLLQPIDIDFTLYYMDTDLLSIVGVGQVPVEFAAGGFGSGLAIDVGTEKLYFVDDDNLQIKRVNTDGSEMEILYEGLTGATNLTIDTENQRVFWTNRVDGTIHRGNMDGSGSAETIVEGLSLPEGIAYHNGKIYFSDVDVPPIGENIYVANTNGTGLSVFVAGSWGYGIGLDAVNERLYFGDQGVYDDPEDNRIKSVNLNDNSDVQVIAEIEPIGGNGSRTYGISVLPEDGKVYWTDRSSGKIKRANLDGSNLETLLVTEGTPRGIALFK